MKRIIAAIVLVAVAATAHAVRIAVGGDPTPIATTEVAGKVKPDGTSVTVDGDGTISSVSNIVFNKYSSGSYVATPANIFVGPVSPGDGANDIWLDTSGNDIGSFSDPLDVRFYMSESVRADYDANPNDTDITAAIQSAMDAGTKTIYFPGRAKVTATLRPPSGGYRFVGAKGVGDYQTAAIYYYGSGPCIELGSDNGHSWDANDYDGYQGFEVENMTLIYAGASTTPLLNGAGNYGTGTYGIKDWRGGAVKLKNAHIYNFEYGVWGIQSDFDYFDDSIVGFNHIGLFLGPRSDQFTANASYSFLNDTAVLVDGSYHANLNNWTTVADGSPTTHGFSVVANYSRGAGDFNCTNCWLENYQSINVQPDFIGVGTSGSYPIKGVKIDSPIIMTGLVGTGHHTNTLMTIGNADGVSIINPQARPNETTISIDTMLDFVGSTSPANVKISGLKYTLPTLYTNSGTGHPTPYITDNLSSISVGSGYSTVYLWANDGTNALETFAATGSAVTSAINTSGSGQSNSNTYATVAGDTYAIDITLTLNSGAAPFFTVLAGDGTTQNVSSYSLTAGTNRIIFTEKASGANALVYVKTTANSDYSFTCLLTKIAAAISGHAGVASASHGAVVKAVAEASKTPTASASFFDIPVNVPAGVRILGAEVKVDSALPGGETWSAAYRGGSTTVIAPAGNAVAAGTIVSRMSAGEISTGVVQVRVTRDSGNFTGTGTISAAVFYETLTNSAAVTSIGGVGEYETASLASGSAISLSNGVATNIASVSLSAGEWDITGVIDYVPSGATTSLFKSGINSVNATFGADDTHVSLPLIATGLSNTLGHQPPMSRLLLGTTTTVYLIGQASFSSGTMTGYGTIRARRVR